MVEDPEIKTVTYWSVSILQSRTAWVNAAAFLVAALSVTDVWTLIPTRYLPWATALLALLNIFLRTQTVRPVSFIAPGSVAPVMVARVGPPAPPLVTD